MTTQVVFKIDQALKQRVERKAKKQGLTLSDLFKMAAYAYDEGLIGPGIVKKIRPKLNAKTRKLLRHELKEVKAGKNLSPAFDNIQDAINYLKNL
jgi:antitoxin component of RelBE/YafQ-DinJ toxin-antitoxin module